MFDTLRIAEVKKVYCSRKSITNSRCFRRVVGLVTAPPPFLITFHPRVGGGWWLPFPCAFPTHTPSTLYTVFAHSGDCTLVMLNAITKDELLQMG